MQGDFSFIGDPQHLRLLKVLLVFTVGSVFGLVSLSHLLAYVLKHYKNRTLALIMGFITGSLGVVWPWKNTIYKRDQFGETLIDTNGVQIVENYQRYLPEINSQTSLLSLFILFGIALVLVLDWYGKKRNQHL